MAYDGRYDDPKMINAFLAQLGATDADYVAPTGHDNTHTTQTAPAEPNLESKHSSGDNTPVVASAVSSPHVGTRAPPPTPESIGTAATDIQHLPPIDEDHDEDRGRTRLPGPYDELTPRFRADASPFQPKGAQNDEDAKITGENNNTKCNSLNENVNPIEVTKQFRKWTLENFKKEAEKRIALSILSNNAASLDDMPDVDPARAVDRCDGDETESLQNDHTHDTASIVTTPFPDTQDDTTAFDQLSDDDTSSIDILVDAPTSPESFKSHKSILAIITPNETNTDEPQMTRSEKVGTAAENDDFVKQDQSREDAVYFPAWGKPSTRTTGPARVRTVTLSCLPVGADYTLAQSLVYGGTLEVFTLVQNVTGATAYITFTDADACDRYYNQHPNGLEFKHQGKRHVAFVDKGKNVDVVSGILQSYLDCGATRVIKVTGADADWSMRALYKIAGGENAHAKVESILDSYRNNVRTIVFRFTKIADAVAFRGRLLRNDEWQDADIQFGADPCERAAGVHDE